MKRILVTGSRDWADWESIREVLEEYRYGDFVLVHGGARGADSVAERIWLDWGLPVERHPADWETHGRMAGPIRNRKMVSLGADVCLAFPFGDSRGTRGCIKEAERAGIPVMIVEGLV